MNSATEDTIRNAKEQQLQGCVIPTDLDEELRDQPNINSDDNF